MALEDSDSRIIDPNVKAGGTVHACFGETPDPKIVNFYAEGFLASTPFTGLGDCHRHKANFPEQGLMALNCFMDLSGLPMQYAGGFLATNTVNSRAVTGARSDPAGYVQASIATIRLWKKRIER